ncbi:aldo/keto reductase [Allokutzneria multivorans]|uniref:Aldo/keto reductase n=1 Tax=Allokutzneria multivorans TaxID=1142134 RepID=A0ABP7R3F8_9PSEU
MQQRRIGTISVSAIGLGGMPLSMPPSGKAMPTREQAIATVHAALDAGITFIDTADAYAVTTAEFGHNEELIAEAVRGRDDVLVATKGGHTRTPDDGFDLDGSPAYLKRACEGSLRRLGVEAIGLYQLHRPDPKVPIEESVSALADLLDEGKIQLAGVSNFNPDEIRSADKILGGRLASVQNEFSPRFRSSLPELQLCDELGIAFLPWSPLGGMGGAADLGSRHAAFAEIAAERGVSAQQVCLAWELAKSERVIPIPGSSRPETVRSSVEAVHLVLSEEELARLDA